jgi:hypothetical protein
VLIWTTTSNNMDILDILDILESATYVFSIRPIVGAPGPGSPRTGPGPWGGDPSPLGTGETPYLNWAGALGLDDPKTTLRVPPVPRNWGPGIACPYRRPRAVLAPGGSERQ